MAIIHYSILHHKSSITKRIGTSCVRLRDEPRPKSSAAFQPQPNWAKGPAQWVRAVKLFSRVIGPDGESGRGTVMGGGPVTGQAGARLGAPCTDRDWQKKQTQKKQNLDLGAAAHWLPISRRAVRRLFGALGSFRLPPRATLTHDFPMRTLKPPSPDPASPACAAPTRRSATNGSCKTFT